MACSDLQSLLCDHATVGVLTATSQWIYMYTQMNTCQGRAGYLQHQFASLKKKKMNSQNSRLSELYKGICFFFFKFYFNTF